MGMNSKTPLYEDTPQFDTWFRLIIAGVLAMPLIIGAGIASEDVNAALGMLGMVFLEAVLFRLLLPRRFQVFDDRLRIVMGGPWAINIPFSKITVARAASGSKALFYGGLRLATSTRHVVEIVRQRGMNLVISPAHDEMFLEQLNKARQSQKPL